MLRYYYLIILKITGERLYKIFQSIVIVTTFSKLRMKIQVLITFFSGKRGSTLN